MILSNHIHSIKLIVVLIVVVFVVLIMGLILVVFVSLIMIRIMVYYIPPHTNDIPAQRTAKKHPKTFRVTVKRSPISTNQLIFPSPPKQQQINPILIISHPPPKHFLNLANPILIILLNV